jgi:major tropism determinant Mtd-like protein
MKQRRGTTAEWTSSNPILADGEIGIDKDTGEIKVGDGVTFWSVLPVILQGIFVQPDSDEPIHLRSPASRTADTARLHVVSFQKQEPENAQNGGEGFWMDLADPRAKNMITWRLAMDKVARTVRTVGPVPVVPPESDMQRIVWAGAHYYAQDQVSYAVPTDVHGHWSVEVPDSTLALRTRFEIRFVGEDGKIGLDKTLIQTASADFVVDASNGQVCRLRSGAGAEKAFEWANDEWGHLKRWRVRTTGAESTGNAGSDWAVARYPDAADGAAIDEPLSITRSSGRVNIGGAAGSAGGATVRRNSGGQALTVDTNYAGAAGATGVGLTPYDAASRVLSSAVQAEATARYVAYADGKQEWGPGGSTGRDVNLYREKTDVLKTDDSVKVGSYTTALRPSAATLGSGAMIFDTTLQRPVWSNGTNWRDAAGTVV